MTRHPVPSNAPVRACSPEWFEEFFTELPNEFWRRMTSAEQTRSEVDAIVARTGLTPPATVLDVACGSGRHVVEFAGRGYDVTGVDVSNEALTHAARSASDKGVPITVHRRDMRDLSDLGRFDLILLLGNSLGYLPEPGLQQLIAALAAATKPGGWLVLDCNVAAESILPGFRPDGDRAPMVAGDITADVDTAYDVLTSCVRTTYTFVQGERRVVATALHHVYTAGHIVYLVRTHGFDRVTAAGDPDGTPYTIGSPRLVLTAQAGPTRPEG